MRTPAASLRALVHRHPHAAPLLTSRRAPPEHALRVCEVHLRGMREGGVSEPCAVALLRGITAHGIGYALAELSCFDARLADTADDVARLRRVTALLPTDASDDLVRTALLVCGDCDMAGQFEIGIDLMIHGLDAYLQTRGDETAASQSALPS